MPEFKEKYFDENDKVILLSLSDKGTDAETEFFSILSENKLTIPVIIKKEYNTDDRELFNIMATIDIITLLNNGYGDGILVENPNLENEYVVQTMFNILQAGGYRISKAEYIACPSCGRTQFDIETSLKKVKEKTNHLKGIKIAVMGCIVNGPGEMADADYGYVGSGNGKVTLYKAKEIVEKNLPEDIALEKLIYLIKENGDWIEN